MTVKELRKFLKAFNPNATVCIAVEDDFYSGEVKGLFMAPTDGHPTIHLTTESDVVYAVEQHGTKEKMVKKDFKKWAKKKRKEREKRGKRK